MYVISIKKTHSALDGLAVGSGEIMQNQDIITKFVSQDDFEKGGDQFVKTVQPPFFRFKGFHKTDGLFQTQVELIFEKVVFI